MAEGKDFTLFGKKPNDIQIGGGFLIVTGTLTIIFAPIKFPGILLLGLGIGAFKKNVACIYLGTFLWLISFLYAFLSYLGLFSKDYHYPAVAVIFQAWILWELIKSTPKYKKFTEKSKNE